MDPLTSVKATRAHARTHTAVHTVSSLPNAFSLVIGVASADVRSADVTHVSAVFTFYNVLSQKQDEFRCF